MFKGCLFFVLSSSCEALGIVNLEAMAAAKAVIATRVGGVPELVLDGVTGLLVKPGDVGELAGAMDRLRSDQALRDRLGKAGAEEAERFGWTEIAGQYIGVYKSVATRSGGV